MGKRTVRDAFAAPAPPLFRLRAWLIRWSKNIFNGLLRAQLRPKI